MHKNQITWFIDPVHTELHNHYYNHGRLSQHSTVTANGSWIKPNQMRWERNITLTLPQFHLPLLLQDEVAILDDVAEHRETGPRGTRNGEFIDGMIILEEALIDLSSSGQGNLQHLPEEKILAHLKTTKYIVGADQESQICTICQTEYEGEESMATTRCGHEYHTDCIRKWLAVKNKCPLCNSTVLLVG